MFERVTTKRTVFTTSCEIKMNNDDTTVKIGTFLWEVRTSGHTEWTVVTKPDVLTGAVWW